MNKLFIKDIVYTIYKYLIPNIKLSCGLSHTFMLIDDTLWGVGYNGYGQLGLGDNNDRNKFTKVESDVKDIICGKYHSYIIKNDNTLWCCGVNHNGQLGLGDYYERNKFTKVGTKVGTKGDTKGFTHDVKKIICGTYHTFLIKNDNTVWCCGDNNFGQIGLGNIEDINRFTKMDDIHNVKKIICGYYHTYVIKNDNTIWCCGSNNFGQLGLGDTDDRNIFTKVGINNVKNIICGIYHTFVIKNDNTIWCCGVNIVGQ